MKPTCEEVQSKFRDLRSLKVRFDHVLAGLKPAPTDLTIERGAGLRPASTRTERTTEAKSLRDTLRTDLESLQTFLGLTLVFRVTSESGEEMVMDLKQEFAESKAFYEAHGLKSFSKTLGEKISLSREGRKQVQEAMRRGYDRVMVCVPHEQQTQEATLEKIIKETTGYENEPFFNEKEKILKAVLPERSKNLRSKPYLLFYSSKPIPEDFKNKTFPELDQMLDEKRLNGFSTPEYLLIQRKEFKKRGNHSWDAHDSDGTKSNWTWLRDACIPGASFGFVDASWSPRRRRVGVSWHVSSNSDPGLGVRSAVLVELSSP